jgi:phenylacetaldehyde dehydrogenase
VQHEISADTRAWLAREHAHYIDGAPGKGSGDVPFDVIDPATGQAIATAAGGGQAEIDAAVSAARAALNGPWRTMTPYERSLVLLELARLCEEHAQLFTEIAVVNGGLPWMIGETTAPFCAMFLRYYAGWCTKIAGKTLPSAPAGRGPHEVHAYTSREPIGVVGAITPWNYPFGMEMLKVAPALATGCTLVLKPAEQTPIPMLILAELATRAGVPDGVFNVVNGLGETAGQALVDHPGVDKLAFTGSTEVGRSIVRAASGNLKRVSLELGGKSPVVVFPDADLETTVPGVALACFSLSGQNCVCGSRLFVHEKIAPALVEGVAEFAKSLAVGPGLDPGNMIGPLISERQRERVLGMIGEAGREGGKLVTGGRAVGDAGFFVEPTVFTDCTPDMQLVREEVFGPVLAVQTFGDEDLETIAERANDTSYGLSASIWTRDVGIAHRMASLIDAGQVGVNCHAAMDPSMPFGGNKTSGWGREFGEEALELYLKTKAVTITWPQSR